ncbi:MAG TPA: phospholipid carrier-dependent glycosyltransferase, partial [Anaerolineae bacterium]|nr:phospholipid carrier-dependent glycosyltransferase [Anaerolineae bacterium]
MKLNKSRQEPALYTPGITPYALHFRLYAPHLALFLFLFAIYLLTYTPRINSSDGLAMFSTAESLVRRGALDIEQIRWMDLQQGTYGLDGLLYSRKGIGVPVGLLPLTWLGLIVPWWGTISASLLFNAIVTALTAVLLRAYLQQLGFSQRTGLIVALTFGLATLAWPYAKSLFSDPFSGLLLLAAAYALLKYSKGAGEQVGRGEKFLSPALFYPFLAGLFLGWNIATRYAEALFVPVFGLLLLYYLFNLQGSKFFASRSALHALL